MSKSVIKTWLAITAILLATALPLAAQEKEIADHPRVKEALHVLDMWIEAELGYKRIPGISVAIVSDQDVIWTKGYGYSNREEKIPARPDTIYSICSISKLFTSVSVMQMRDAGKFQLDDALADHLSWFKIVHSDPNAPPITIRSVMTHSSGLPRESEQPYKGEPDLPWAERESIIETLPSQTTMYPPSKHFMYSNLGISLLGEMVAEISGMTYQDYLAKNVLVPLGMNDTTPYLPEDQLGKRLAVGYSRLQRDSDRVKLGFFQANGITPAAGLASTALDLAKFASWQFRALEEGKDNPILSGYTLKEMHRVQWVNPDWGLKWGLGFATWQNNGITFVGHGGGCPGYSTHLLLNPKDKIATISMINASGSNPTSITKAAHNLLKPAILEALKSDEEVETSPAEYEPYYGLYRTHWHETAVFPWKGKIGMISFPYDDPANHIREFEKVGEHTFKEILENGDYGDKVEFEFDEDGKVKWFKSHSFYVLRVD